VLDRANQGRAELRDTMRMAAQWTVGDLATLDACVALATLPFESERLALALGPVTLTHSEALVGTAVVLSIAGGARTLRCLDRRFAVAAGALVLAFLVSAAFAPEHRANAVKFALRTAGGAAFGVAIAMLVRERSDRAASLLSAYTVGVGAAAVVGVAEALWGSSLDPGLAYFRESPIFVAGTRRLTSTFEYPNILAASIALAFPAMAASIALDRGWRRLAAIVGAVACTPTLLLTYSRGGLGATLVGLGALAVVAWRPLDLERTARVAAACLAAIVAMWIALVATDNLLARRASGLEDRPLLGASYRVLDAPSWVAPGADGRMRVEITNIGTLPWQSTYENPFLLTSTWLQPDGSTFVDEGPRNTLPAVVAPGETVAVDAAFEAPSDEGTAWLAWHVIVEHRLRFGEIGSDRGRVLLAVSREPTTPRAIAPPPVHTIQSTGTIAPPRAALWRAALAMVASRPMLGFGPDSYRLTYGRFLGLDAWDERVFANNVALELLATTGLFGTTTFAVVCAVVAMALARSIRRPAARAGDRAAVAVVIAALVAWVAHGTLDYFLEATVGYTTFWMLCGVAVGVAPLQPRAGIGSDTVAL